MQKNHIPKLKICALFFLFFVTSAYASNQKNNSQTISNCLSQVDTTSCLLRIAEQRANTIKDTDKKAEAITSIIWAYADTKKENPELFKSAWNLYNQSQNKISASNQLGLYTSLVAYLASVDKKNADKALPDLYGLYKKIRASKKNDDQIAAVTWACDLFGSDDAVWKITKIIFISECTNQSISHLNTSNDIELFQKTTIKFQKNVAWSDKENAIETFSSIWNLNQELLKLAGSNDGKKIRNEIYSFSAVLKLMQADSIVRFVNYSAAKNEIDEANIYIGKIDTSSYDGLDMAISSKMHYVKFLSDWGRISDALKAISEIEGTVEASIVKRRISSPDEISYLTKYAHLKYIDKNFDLADKLRIEKNQTLRQADVLYTTYKVYSSAKTKNINDPDRPELNLLIEAAEARHPLAMYELGLINSNGMNGAPINKAAAFYWYSQSALDGFAGAQNNLGDLYERGEGVAQSYSEAIYWYTQAAMQGEPTAYLSLGEIFYKGLGANKNFQRAAFWLSLAYQNLQDGTNKKLAQNLLNATISEMSKKEINFLYWQVTMFKPLRQTEYTLGDTPKKFD